MATDENSVKSTKSTGRPLGPTGETVRSNIKRIRERRRIAVTELSARMRKLDRSIPPLGIHRIEDGQRRVDVDDLAAFAVALGVSPASLLMPQSDTAHDMVSVTGYPDTLAAGRVWAWLGGGLPVSEDHALATLVMHGWPPWRWHEVNEAVKGAMQERLIEQQRLFDQGDRRAKVTWDGLPAAELEEDSDGDD
ncbi:XRE family transcriptional regulator [Mycobacterium attenuatum]|uniref:XRE family transcriptional regulator n=1 Tax=Mycobacterium attenuatum TaxID=2341086 RepID=UPI0010A961C0|nr:XRE family transcriptional regulator [Mycobacterium attenuatum]